MAEKRRRRRAYRQAWSVLSLAGTTTAVWTAAGLAKEEGPAPGGAATEAAVDVAAVPGPAQLGALALGAEPAHPRADGRGLSVLPEDVDTTPTSLVPAGPVLGERPRAATTGDAPTATPTPEEVGRAALERVGYPWEDVLAGWSIQFHEGRAGLLGGTWTYERRIEIYVRPDHSVDEVAFTLAHEIGHAVDVTLLDDADRGRWRASRGIPAQVPWWVESGATDFSSCSGDWAEAFAVWLVGGWSHSKVAGQPTPAQLELLAELAR